MSLLALHLLNTPCSFPPFLPGTNNGYKHKNPPWNTYLYPGTDIIIVIRGTTRIESQSCIVLSKIPLFVRNVQSTYQPTFHSTLPYLLVQLVCSRVFPIVPFPQMTLSVGGVIFLSSYHEQSLFHRFTILKFVLNVSTCFFRLQEGISNFM